jgi:hypothetical protein
MERQFENLGCGVNISSDLQSFKNATVIMNSEQLHNQ